MRLALPDGSREWRVNGQLHRKGGPAYIGADGTQQWWIKGIPHRDNGPAQVAPDGYHAWLFKGAFHRHNGPARLWSDGSQEWLFHGLHHRLDGPAIIRADATREWYVNGKDITKKVHKWIQHLRIPPWQGWTATDKMLFRLTFGPISDPKQSLNRPGFAGGSNS
jgi:hypothetical protein